MKHLVAAAAVWSMALALRQGANRPKAVTDMDLARLGSHRRVAPQNAPTGSRQLALGAIAFLICAQASAQVTPNLYYDETVKRGGTVSPLSDDMFGDSISMVDGRVSFRQTDISLPTNSQLRVEFGRRTPHANQGREPATAVMGLYWEMDVPYLFSTYDTRKGWVAGGAGTQARCSSGTLVPPGHTGPWPYYHTTWIQQHTWWKGIDIVLPGEGTRKMLELAPGQDVPTDGEAYVATASGNVMVSCLPSLKNAVGEGFRIVTPDGREFFFDWMATRNAYDSKDNESNPTTDYDDGNHDYWHTITPLTDYFLYATLVKDRFGNFVKYTYDQSNPHRLISIESNDGVLVTLSYAPDGLLSSATTNGRTWGYEYGAAPSSLAASKQLVRVLNPDGSHWELGITGYPFEGGVPPMFWNSCGMDPGTSSASAPNPTTATNVVSMTHPSGALGVFKFRNIVHGKNRSPGGCSIANDYPDGSVGSFSFAPYGVPAVYGVASIYSKTISGPGLTTMQWGYTYFPTWSYDPEWESSSGLCPGGPCNTSQTKVTEPGGVSVMYTFGNDIKYNDGRLLKVDRTYGGISYEQTTTTFVAVGAPNLAFPATFGEIPTGVCLDMSGYSATIDRCAPYGNRISVMNLPVTSETRLRDGVAFRRIFSNFDARARPTKVVKSSGPTL